jgi:16S rRNA (cytosine1402-N4)-methyltransferase
VNRPHIPVLLDEVLDSFVSLDDGYIVDCTLGYAGHSLEILKSYPHLKHIGIDRDQEALDFSSNALVEFSEKSTLYKGRFSDIFPTLTETPIKGILADFGVSSLQLDRADRGFSFESELLDMRMDSSASLSAYEVVNSYSRERLEYIFDHYGEVRSYRKLTGAILEARAIEPILSARRLSEIIREVIPQGGKINPSTLPFQAIRIEVNDELGEIERLLDALEESACSGAVVSLITFHSLEDRLVKNRFKKWTQKCICDPHAIRCTCSRDNALGRPLKRKPITATKDELRVNPRSRSAKLRSFRFDER